MYLNSINTPYLSSIFSFGINNISAYFPSISNSDFTDLEVVDNDFDFKISDQFDEALVNIEIKIFDCALAVNKNNSMALRKRITNKALRNAKWLVVNKKDYL